MAKKSKSFKIGRDSRTGRLKTVRDARSEPDTSQVEHMPKRGRGDTGRKRKKKKR